MDICSNGKYIKAIIKNNIVISFTGKLGKLMNFVVTVSILMDATVKLYLDTLTVIEYYIIL